METQIAPLTGSRIKVLEPAIRNAVDWLGPWVNTKWGTQSAPRSSWSLRHTGICSAQCQGYPGWAWASCWPPLPSPHHHSHSELIKTEEVAHRALNLAQKSKPTSRSQGVDCFSLLCHCCWRGRIFFCLCNVWCLRENSWNWAYWIRCKTKWDAGEYGLHCISEKVRVFPWSVLEECCVHPNSSLESLQEDCREEEKSFL